MLVLKRNISEQIMIGDDVVVSVLGVRGNQVSIGVTAPKEVPVHREEIYRKANCQPAGPRGKLTVTAGSRVVLSKRAQAVAASIDYLPDI